MIERTVSIYFTDTKYELYVQIIVFNMSNILKSPNVCFTIKNTHFFEVVFTVRCHRDFWKSVQTFLLNNLF